LGVVAQIACSKDARFFYKPYEDLVFYLKTLPYPLIIFDEAGDLQYDAFLEIKALWNATGGDDH